MIPSTFSAPGALLSLRKPRIITPRGYQDHAVDALWRYMEQNPGRNPVVVMPTGTGKSIVIGAFMMRALQKFPATRIMCLTHVKELIGQNAAKLELLWPSAPYGVHSAGLKQRDVFQSLIFGGVQTVRNSVARFPLIHILMVDECHLLSPNAETSYWEIINALRAINPNLVVVGFTATDYRRNQGRLTDGDKALFNGIAIDMSTMEWWAWFIANGYLVPPKTRKTAVTFEMAGVGVQNGDYKLSEMNDAVDEDKLNSAVAGGICEGFYNRHKGLVFCAGVDHAEHIASLLNRRGVNSRAVHTRNDAKERDRAIAEFLDPYSGLDVLTNNNVLTTGFDAPMLDYIGMARPTVSASLWVQMLGRGTRPYGDPRTCSPDDLWQKHDCLVDDFAGNTARLGPVNDPVIPKPPGSGPPGEAPVKLCDACGCYNHASARVCIYCGNEFVFKPKIMQQASHHDLYKGDVPQIEFFSVNRVFYTPHHSRAGNDMIRVQYHCGMKQWSEYLNFDQSKLGQHLAREWWRQFVSDAAPLTNREALERLENEKPLVPTRIKVHVNRTPPEVVGYEFG